MTLLTICQSVADEIKDTRPTAVLSSTDSTVQMYFRLANRVGKQLMKKVVWQALRNETTFTALSTETQTGILAADFDRFVPETFWNRTDRTLLTGPISAVEWQSLKALEYAGFERKFILRGGSILIIPTLAGGEALAFEYVSNKWARSSADAAQASFLADADTSVIDEELIVRGMKYVYLTDEGLPNGAAAADFNDYFDMVIRNDQPASQVMSAGDIFGGSSSRNFGGAPYSSAPGGWR
jgi:hypothetical protein